jgi:hypothetical protein
VIRLGAAALAVVALGLSACGSDDDPATAATTTEADAATTTAASSPDSPAASEEYCTLAQELNEQEDLPTSEQLERYQSLAPEAVAEPVAVVVEAFAAADGDPSKIFGDPDTTAAIEELTAFEAEACGLEPPQDPDVTELDEEATRIEVTATDYAFELDVPTAAGRYSFVMANEGSEPHLLVLAQLEPGATLDEAMASEGEEGVATSFESGVAAPGAETVVTADLGPGDWVLICPIPDAEGTTHVEHGMVREFSVT